MAMAQAEYVIRLMVAFGSLEKGNSHATLQGIKRLVAACGVQWSLSDGFPPARAALTGGGGGRGGSL